MTFKRNSGIDPCTEGALNTWAAQKRSMFMGVSSVSSVMGTLLHDRNAAGSGDAVRRQKWPEVYTGDGERVQRVVLKIRDTPRFVLTFSYVLRWPWRVPVKDQREALGLSKTAYWDALDRGEAQVETGLQVLEDVRTAQGAEIAA